MSPVPPWRWREGQNVADYARLPGGAKSDDMAVSNELVSRVNGQAVITGMLALHKPDGGFDGVVAISLDTHWIDYMMRASNLPKARWWRCSTEAAR